ncbi:hypothetical protein [Constantimarinum furrinae]|nr:hypothetical protein [Constantimarinum furrinae]
MSGIQGMITTLKNNKKLLSKRKKMFERDGFYQTGRYGKLEDHKKMRTFEFAQFQKDLFKKKKKETRNRRVKFLITLILTILVLWSLPYILDLIFYTEYFDMVVPGQ